MKKTKKKGVLKKKEKIALAIAGIILFVIILGISLMPTRKRNNQEQKTNNTDLNRELSSVQEIVEYLEATYVSTEDSKASGYDIDIYVNFPYNLYEGEISKEIYFKNFYEKIARITNFKSFRLIDSNRKITIEIKCENGKIKEVKINGETDYYQKTLSAKSKDNMLEFETKEFKINSPELQSLINNNWVTANASLGTPESKFYKYDVYFDEGYEIRTIQGKTFNIVFNKKYGNDVIEGYKPGDDLEKIKTSLGTPYENKNMIEYKTKDFYVIFSNEEISIYPNRRNDYTEFEKLVEKYNEKQDINDFIYELTDIWPDYDIYNNDNNYVELYYTLKGVKISFSSRDSEGIQIYENYKGDLKTNTEEYKNVYYKLDQNLMLEAESERRFVHELTGERGSSEDSILISDEFQILASYDNESYKNIKIYSLNENYPNNEFEDYISIKSYVWADNEHLIYSISNDGIYMYTATTRQIDKMLDGKQTFNITNYNRNTKALEYDGQTVMVSF
ncbi:MAG: polyphosphate polymerase domain-containing protein [Clostridia bacterium]|jgi:hypothetical protein|nr:polyphosphate polymerase domain-containing protein [Clostridia bacterium]